LDRGAAERGAIGQQKFHLASKLTKMNVKDSTNQSIGQIQDLLIDDSGQVQYIAITAQGAAAANERLQPRTPGAQSNQPGTRSEDQPSARPDQPGARPGQPGARLQPGAGASDVAEARMSKVTLVPYDAVEFHEGETAAQAYVILNIDKDRFTQAPTFTAQQLTAQGQQAQWMSQVDQFFDREKSGAARPDLNTPDRNNQNRNDLNRKNENRDNQNRGTQNRDNENRGTQDREESDIPRQNRDE